MLIVVCLLVCWPAFAVVLLFAVVFLLFLNITVTSLVGDLNSCCIFPSES